MKELLNRISFKVTFHPITRYLKIRAPFAKDPGLYLILKCDKEARLSRESIDSKPNDTNLKYYGNYIITKYNTMLLRSVKELIRINNAIDSEIAQTKYKLDMKVEFINMNTRDTFSISSVTISMIKYVYSFNHYAIWDQNINENILSDKYSRYSERETWDHIILCQKTKYYQKNFIIKLRNKLTKVKLRIINEEEIDEFLEDILRYFDDKKMKISTK